MTEHLGYYVYALRDPRKRGQPGGGIFYVGKGHNDRVYQHARASLSASEETRLEPRLETIREIRREGHEVGVEIIRYGMDSDDAFQVEAGVIDALVLAGICELANQIRGRDVDSRGWQPLTELRATYAAPKLAEVPDDERVMFIRVNQLYRPGMNARDTYEATRRWWRRAKSRKPRLALAVYHGVVRGVYYIVDWEDAPEGGEDAGRSGFRGAYAEEVHGKYVWRNAGDFDDALVQNLPLADVLVRKFIWHDVACLMGKGQYPISYGNC